MKDTALIALGLGVMGFALFYEGFTGRGESLNVDRVREGEEYRVTVSEKATGEIVSSSVRSGSAILRDQKILGLALIGASGAVVYFSRKQRLR